MNTYQFFYAVCIPVWDICHVTIIIESKSHILGSPQKSNGGEMHLNGNTKSGSPQECLLICSDFIYSLATGQEVTVNRPNWTKMKKIVYTSYNPPLLLLQIYILKNVCLYCSSTFNTCPIVHIFTLPLLPHCSIFPQEQSQVFASNLSAPRLCIF